MDNKIRPITGITAEEYLSEWEGDNVWNGLLREHLKLDTCFSKEQAGELDKHVHDLEVSYWDEIEFGVKSDVPVFVNRFRLDCSNCLRKDCPRRDSSAPFQEVKKRDLLYELYENGSYDPFGAHFSEDGIWEAFIEAKIQTFGELCEYSERELKNLPGFSNKSIEEIKANLAQSGLELKKD